MSEFFTRVVNLVDWSSLQFSRTLQATKTTQPSSPDPETDMESSVLFPLSDPENVYAIGSFIDIQDPSSPTQLISLRITRHLAVSEKRTSQVVVAQLKNDLLWSVEENHIITSTSPVVAKIFDPEFAPAEEECKGGSVEVCARLKNCETHAYSKLSDLQGCSITEFYGEYIYKPSMESTRLASVLLFQFVDDPPLTSYICEKFTAEEKEALKTNAFAALDKIHQRGVYPYDIAPRNILCRRYDMKITILDFGYAVFDDVNYWNLEGEGLLKQRELLTSLQIKHDIAMMWRTLCVFDVQDDRPRVKLGLISVK
jgi:serine/threonine protein kinase